MGIFKRLSELIKGQSSKKLIESAVIFIIIGVIIIIAGGSFFEKDNKEEADSEPKNNNVEVASTSVEEGSTDVERKLAAILSKINGAGKVDVMITYVSGKEIVPAYDIRTNENSTQEKDKEGGTRNINQSDQEKKIVYEEQQGGTRKPIILKDMQPVVKGVVVVAEGASEPVVKENICRAVQVLMDIPIHKVQVFESKK
jgi:stage III sporulation protein AG